MTTPPSRLRFALFTALAVFAVLFATGTASAAVPIGQSCTPTSGGPQSAIQKSTTGGTGYSSPIDGVITHWGINRTGIAGDSTLTLIVGGETSPGTYTVSATSMAIIAPASAVTEQDARVAIKAGQSIGYATTNAGSAMLCPSVDSGDVMAWTSTFLVTGSNYAAGLAPNYRLPVFATVEADVDKDGFGDETQDKCPQSAALQSPCPVLAISQQLAAAKNAISITAAASVDTSLTATAKVKVPKLGSKKAATVTFSSKATAFAAGQIKSIKLKLPSRVKDALAATKKSKKLKFTVTLTGKGLANTASSVKSISLPGTLK